MDTPAGRVHLDAQPYGGDVGGVQRRRRGMPDRAIGRIGLAPDIAATAAAADWAAFWDEALATLAARMPKADCTPTIAERWR